MPFRLIFRDILCKKELRLPILVNAKVIDGAGDDMKSPKAFFIPPAILKGMHERLPFLFFRNCPLRLFWSAVSVMRMVNVRDCRRVAIDHYQ
jgi:hypothetical protein